MKKVVIVILNILLIFSIFLLVYSNKNYEIEVNENQKIEQKIEEIKNITIDKMKQNEKYENEITNLKEQYKNELKEQNIWKKMKEKLEQASS